MAIVGIVLALIAAFIIDQLLSPLIPSGPHFLIASVLGAWAAWPCFRKLQELRTNKLHPPKTKYKLSLPKAFKAVTDVLDLNTIRTQRWQYLARTPGERHIKAQITWTEKSMGIDGFGTNARAVTTTLQHSLQLEVWFEDAGEDSTVVTIDWTPMAGSMSPFACDEVITTTMNAILDNLGEGEEIESQHPTIHRSGPPLALLILTGLTMLAFTAEINKSVEDRRKHYEEEKQQSGKRLNDYKERIRNGEAEIADWESYKRQKGL